MSLSIGRQPEHGARFELSLLGVEEARTRYAARVHLPEACHDYTLVIALPEGTCTLGEAGGASQGSRQGPAPWVTAHLLALGRQLYREGRTGAWPRRLMRWRGAPGSG